MTCRVYLAIKFRISYFVSGIINNLSFAYANNYIIDDDVGDSSPELLE